MLTQDEIRALAFLIALALIGAGLAHLDARHPRFLALTLGDSLALGRPAADPGAAADAVFASPGTSPALADPAHPGRAAAPAAPETSSIDLGGRMDVNRAGPAELELLPGVGPRLAERIVEERRLHGRFKKARDLRRVKGIGEKTLARLLPYIRTESAADTTR